VREGEVLAGQYRLCERVGRGAYGVVWRAEEVRGGRAVVAVKVFLDQPEEAEMAMLASLDHPHILRYRATIEHDGQLCLVTDFADGGDLEARLRTCPQGLPVAEAHVVLRDVAAALQHLHGQRIVHRDLKPKNLLVVRGAVRLADVGQSKALERSATHGTMSASPTYAAPEVYEGRISTAVDIYAWGVTAYELLTGQPPFVGNPFELMDGHRHRVPAPLPDHVPEPLRAIVLRCLAKQPEDRPSADELVAALAARSDERVGAAPQDGRLVVSPPPAWEMAAGEPGRLDVARGLVRGRGWLPLAAFAVLVVLGLVGGWAAVRFTADPHRSLAAWQRHVTILRTQGRTQQAALEASALLARHGGEPAVRRNALEWLRAARFDAVKPTSVEALREAGMQVYRNGDTHWRRHRDLAGRNVCFEVAGRMFARAAQLAPGNVEPVFNQAVVLIETDRGQAALPLLERVVAGASETQLEMRARARELVASIRLKAARESTSRQPNGAQQLPEGSLGDGPGVEGGHDAGAGAHH
jgi:hypothetical protein